jgi:Nuclease-related domain
LRRLAKRGWTVVHDVDRGRGNIDHIVVGPSGIFLIDSKDLHGAASVERGRLSVRWREAPDGGYENRSLAPRIRVAAIELERALRQRGLAAPRVQPVVALWALFEQRSVISGGVAWVHGKDLADVLERRPVTLSPSEVDRAAAALRSAMIDGLLG